MTGSEPNEVATTRSGVVRAFLYKDLRMRVRDRFYVVVSIVGIGFFVAVFWMLPDEVDETFRFGIHMADESAILNELEAQDGAIEVVRFDTADALEAAVADGDPVVAGLAIPPGFADAIAIGAPTRVRIVLGADAPAELRPAMAAIAREIALALVDAEPPVSEPGEDAIVVGTDRAGQQQSLRDGMRPLFVFMALFVEMFALGSLVAVEIQQRTITAVLATPARIADVLVAKTVIGTLLAFSQAAIVLIATGAALRAPSILATTVLLGAVLVTAVGMIAGSLGRDFIGVVAWSMLIGLPLLVPAVGALFPGSAPWWIRALPSHGLVQAITGTTAYGDGWAQVAGHLGVVAAWCLALFALAVVVLRRRMAKG